MTTVSAHIDASLPTVGGGLVASSHHVYRKPMLRHRPSNTPFMPLHPALEHILRRQEIGVAPITQLAVLWNGLAVDGSAVLLLTPTALYRIPCATESSDKLTSAASTADRTPSSRQQPNADSGLVPLLEADDDHISCIPLDLVAFVHRQAIPYLSVAFEAVRFVSKPLPNSTELAFEARSGGANPSVAIAVSLRSVDVVDIKRVLQAVAPAIAWADAGSEERDGMRAGATSPQRTNPVTVVYPLITFADVAARDAMDGRLGVAYDRLKLMADTFHVAIDEAEEPAGADAMPLVGCSTDRFMSCVLAAKARLAPAAAAVPAWAREKEQLLAQMRGMDEETEYLRTQVELLSRHATIPSTTHNHTPGVGSSEQHALQAELTKLNGPPSAKEAIAALFNDLAAQQRRHEGTLQDLRQAMAVATHGLPLPLLLHQQLQGIQRLVLQLDGLHMRVHPTAARTHAPSLSTPEVTLVINELSTSVRKMLSTPAIAKSDVHVGTTSSDGGATPTTSRSAAQNHKATQRALEDTVKLIEQHRLAEVELSSSVDALRLRLIGSQCDAALRTRFFLRWYAVSTASGARRGSRIQISASELQKQLNDMAAAKQRGEATLTLEVSSLRTRIAQLEEERHATAAAASTERSKLVHALEDEREALQTRCAALELRRATLSEQNAALEASLLEQKHRAEALEAQLTASDKQRAAATEAARLAAEEQHAHELNLVRASLREVQTKLREAESTAKAEAHRWETTLETERNEHMAKKQAEMATVRAAMEEELDVFHQRALTAQRQRDAAIAQIASLQTEKLELQAQLSETRASAMSREKDLRAQHELEINEITRQWLSEVQDLRTEQQRTHTASEESLAAAAELLRNVRDAAQKQSSESEKQVVTLRGELEAAKRALKGMERLHKDMLDEKAALESENQQRTERLEAAREELQATREQCRVLQCSVDETTLAMDAMRRQQETSKHVSALAMSEHQDALLRQVSELQSQVQGLHRERDGLAAGKADADSECARLRDEMQRVSLDAMHQKSEASAALEMLRDVEEELQTIHHARTQLLTAVADMQAQHREDAARHEAQLRSLQEEHRRYAMERAQLIEQHEAVSAAAAVKHEQFVRTSEERTAALESELQVRDTRLHDGLVECQSLSHQLRDALDSLKASEAKETQLRRAMARREEEWERQLEDMQRTAATQELSFSTLSEQLKGQEANLVAVTTSRDSLRSQVSHMEDDNHRLQRLVDSLKSGGSQREAELMKTNEADRARLKALHDHELRDAQDEVAKLMHQLEAATSRAAHAAHEAKSKQDGMAKQLQKLATDVSEAKTHQKHAQAESLAQGEMLRDMERELAVVHGHLRDTSAELQAAEESVFRLEQERESWAQQTRRLHGEAQRSEAASKEALQGLQTALLTLSHESEMKERELTSALERMSHRESAERTAERKELESRIAVLQEEVSNLCQERNELAARSSAMARRAKDAQDAHNETMDEQRAAEGQLKAEAQRHLMAKLDQAMSLASELERELSMQFKKEQALTKALEDSAKRVVELNEENRSMLLLLEKTKQDNAALLLTSDSALSNVRGERTKLLSVHEEELRLERDRVRRLEHERDTWSSERLELQRDYEGKLQRSFELEKSRIAELTASWEVEREKIAKDHKAQLEVLRKACQTTERRAEGLLSEVQHQQDLVVARDARIVELQESLHQASVRAQEQAAAAAYKLSAALEMLSDVEVEASVHERSVVSSAEEVATLQNHLASLVDVERKLDEARTEGQQHLARQFRLEEALSDSSNLVARLQRDVANLTTDLAAAKAAFQEVQHVAHTRSDQIAQQATNVSTLTDANAKLSLEISSMTAKRAETEAQWDGKIAALAAERERMRSAHEQQVAVLQDERQRDASRTMAIQDENAALVKQLATDQNIIAALRSELDAAERGMVKLHNQMQAQERELHSAQEELAKIDFLPRGALSNRPTAADTVKLLADDLRQVLDEKKRAMEREELLLRQLRDMQTTQQTNSDQSVKMCLDVITGLETDLTELQHERDRLQSRLADSSAEVAALHANNDATEHDLAAHKEQVAELQELNAELEEEAEAAIVESQRLACKIDELDAAMARFSKEKQEIKEEAEKSTHSVLRTLEGQVDNIIQGVRATEERHQEEILEMQHQLECAEAVFQGLNLSLADKSTRLDVATNQLRALKEEHLGELKRVRQRYAVSLREQFDASTQTAAESPINNKRAATTSPPVASVNRSIAPPRPLHAAALDMDHGDDDNRDRRGHDAGSRHSTADAQDDAAAIDAQIRQLEESAAVERMNAQLAKDEVDVLAAQLESARLELGAVLERQAKTASEVTILKLNLEEESYERELLQRRLTRLAQEHEQEIAALVSLHEDRTNKAVTQGDEQVKRLLSRLVQADEALQAALSDKTQCKDTLKVVLEETANAVAMIKDTELASRSREADLELNIHQLQSHLSARETEHEVQQSVLAHLRVSHEAEIADVHARLKHMSEALQAAHQEINVTHNKLSTADRTIERILHELQVLTQEHDDVVHAKDALELQLHTAEAANDALKLTLTDEQRKAHQTTEDRNQLYTIVTEAAQSAGMIAEERDALAAKLDAFLCRPTATTGTQCIDAFRTSQSTQYDLLISHKEVLCVPVQANAFAATEVVPVRDVGTEAGHGLGGYGHGNGAAVGACSWTTTGMNTDETHMHRASTSTQAAAVVEHRAVATQPTDVATTGTSMAPPPRFRDAHVDTMGLIPSSSAGHHKAVQTGWQEYLTASTTQTASSETLHSGAQCDSPVLSPRGSQTTAITLCDATTCPLAETGWSHRDAPRPLLASTTQTTSSELLHIGAQCESPVMTPRGSQTDHLVDDEVRGKSAWVAHGMATAATGGSATERAIPSPREIPTTDPMHTHTPGNANAATTQSADRCEALIHPDAPHAPPIDPGMRSRNPEDPTSTLRIPRREVSSPTTLPALHNGPHTAHHHAPHASANTNTFAVDANAEGTPREAVDGSSNGNANYTAQQGTTDAQAVVPRRDADPALVAAPREGPTDAPVVATTLQQEETCAASLEELAPQGACGGAGVVGEQAVDAAAKRAVAYDGGVQSPLSDVPSPQRVDVQQGEPTTNMDGGSEATPTSLRMPAAASATARSPRTTPVTTRTKSPRTPRVASELDRLRREADIDAILTDEQFARTTIFADEVGRRRALGAVLSEYPLQSSLPVDHNNAPHGGSVPQRAPPDIDAQGVVGTDASGDAPRILTALPMAPMDAAAAVMHTSPSGATSRISDAPPLPMASTSAILDAVDATEGGLAVPPQHEPDGSHAPSPRAGSASTSSSTRRSRGMSPATRAAKSQVHRLLMERDVSTLLHDEVFQRALVIADEAGGRKGMALQAITTTQTVASSSPPPSATTHPVEEGAPSPLPAAISPIGAPNEQSLSEPLKWSDSEADDDVGGDATQFFEEDSPAQRPQDAMDAMFHETLAEGDTSLLLQDEAPLPSAASNGPSHFFLDGHTTPTRFPGMSSAYSMATSPPPASAVGPTGGYVGVQPTAVANPAAMGTYVATLDDYDLCVGFADGMEVIEEDEFLDWTDLIQLHETEVYHALEREELRRVEGDQMRRFMRNDDVPSIPEAHWGQHDDATEDDDANRGDTFRSGGYDAQWRSGDADANGDVPHAEGGLPLSHSAAYHNYPQPQQVVPPSAPRDAGGHNTGKDARSSTAAATVATLPMQQQQPPPRLQQRLPETSRHHRQVLPTGTNALPGSNPNTATTAGGRSTQPTDDATHGQQPPAVVAVSPAQSGGRSVSQQSAYVPATSASTPRSAASVFAAARGRQTPTGNGGTTPSKMSPYFIAGKNALVLQHTPPPPIRKAVGGKLSSSHLADVLAAMTSEREEAQETSSRVQNIAALMARTRRQTGGK